MNEHLDEIESLAEQVIQKKQEVKQKKQQINEDKEQFKKLFREYAKLLNDKHGIHKKEYYKIEKLVDDHIIRLKNIISYWEDSENFEDMYDEIERILEDDDL